MEPRIIINPIWNHEKTTWNLEKKHKNWPGTMKIHENRPGTMKNQPGTIKANLKL